MMITMGHDYHRILAAVQGTIWAIQEEKFCSIREMLILRAQGYAFDADEIRARIGAAGDRGRQQAKRGAVGVIPLMGVISQRQNLMSETSGGTSIEGFTRTFRQALNDPAIESIVIDVDSPGGAVPGVTELASEIHRARDQKRIVAVANSLAASAAYWIGSAASEFVAIPSADVGSVGVFAVHEDLSVAEEKFGIKTTLIKAGKFKAEGHPSVPLDAESRAHIQERVDDVYAQFTRDLARNRGVPVATVRSDFGEGRTLSANNALAAGMVDRIATFDEVIDRVAKDLPLAAPKPNTAALELRRRRLALVVDKARVAQ